MPPGFQICRFFFGYDMANGERLDAQAIAESFKRTAVKLPKVLHVADLPLGSRGFEYCQSAAIILTQSALFRFNDDPFSLGKADGSGVSELISQAYVSNTRGYCVSVIEGIRYLLTEANSKIFPAVTVN